MGTRGPKPLPANVHLLRGNASKKPLASLLDDVVRPPVDEPDCPSQITGEARAEWDRIVPHLMALGLLSQIDRAALVAYCVAWAEYLWACDRIDAYNTGDVTGERGRVWDTPSGYKQMSVLIQIRNRAAGEMKTWLAEFGMSPAARSRVTQSDPATAGEQGELPGMEKPREGGWATYE